MDENTNGLDCLFPQFFILALGFLSSCLVFYLLQFIILKKTIYFHLFDSSMDTNKRSVHFCLQLKLAAALATLTRSWAVPAAAAAKAG